MTINPTILFAQSSGVITDLVRSFVAPSSSKPSRLTGISDTYVDNIWMRLAAAMVAEESPWQVGQQHSVMVSGVESRWSPPRCLLQRSLVGRRNVELEAVSRRIANYQVVDLATRMGGGAAPRLFPISRLLVGYKLQSSGKATGTPGWFRAMQQDPKYITFPSGHSLLEWSCEGVQQETQTFATLKSWLLDLEQTLGTGLQFVIERSGKTVFRWPLLETMELLIQHRFAQAPFCFTTRLTAFDNQAILSGYRSDARLVEVPFDKIHNGDLDRVIEAGLHIIHDMVHGALFARLDGPLRQGVIGLAECHLAELVLPEECRGFETDLQIVARILDCEFPPTWAGILGVAMDGVFPYLGVPSFGGPLSYKIELSRYAGLDHGLKTHIEDALAALHQARSA